MAWYNFWKKKEEKKEWIITPSSTVVIPQNTDPTQVKRQEWRNGMWVVTSKGLGIIFEIGNDLLIHLINDKGETVNATIENRQSVRQARFDEIPISRKVGLTKERAEYLGYM